MHLFFTFRLETICSVDNHYLLMDRAYEDDKTRSLAMENGFIPVIPPKKNCKDPCNEVEHYFLRLKRFRKVFTRYDKLDVIFLAVIMSAMIFDAVFV